MIDLRNVSIERNNYQLRVNELEKEKYEEISKLNVIIERLRGKPL